VCPDPAPGRPRYRPATRTDDPPPRRPLASPQAPRRHESLELAPARPPDFNPGVRDRRLWAQASSSRPVPGSREALLQRAESCAWAGHCWDPSREPSPSWPYLRRRACSSGSRPTTLQGKCEMPAADRRPPTTARSCPTPSAATSTNWPFASPLSRSDGRALGRGRRRPPGGRRRSRHPRAGRCGPWSFVCRAAPDDSQASQRGGGRRGSSCCRPPHRRAPGRTGRSAAAHRLPGCRTVSSCRLADEPGHAGRQACYVAALAVELPSAELQRPVDDGPDPFLAPRGEGNPELVDDRRADLSKVTVQRVGGRTP
jgi:hypothetical protein